LHLADWKAELVEAAEDGEQGSGAVLVTTSCPVWIRPSKP
jgi:hypothetical protein